MRKILSLFLFLSITGQLFGQQFWSKKENINFKYTNEEIYVRKSNPEKLDIYTLELESFTSYLSSRNSGLEISLPINSNEFQKFRIRESSNLAPELSAKFPMIKSYTGYGIEDPTAIVKIDIGTNGIHAIVFSGNHSTLYIDPYTKDNKEYIIYQRADLNQEDQDFICQVEDSKKDDFNQPNFTERNADDGKLRTFRLALACTGEYAQYHLTQQGVDPGATDAVKKAAVLSAMNTTMNRVNGVYEIDLGVRMEIVANNDAIIFLDAAADGFSNTNAISLLSQNQTTCDTEIGSANYDIGHVFSTGGGGVAGLGVVCSNGSKARGVTGRGAPINDPFDIDYVAHEMGHQFGANHTFNNSCSGNRNFSTAVEPGSGSTIMAYAGICTPNVQSNSDDHFSIISINEMWNLIQTTATCGVETATGNATPTADAGSDVAIPKSTPFVLRGIGTDIDGTSTLTYNWEQVDNEIAAMPPEPTNTFGPMFRSLSSKTSPNRYMPALSTIIAGNTSTDWEVLPSVARELDFALTVRDNNPGGSASARDDIRVTVTDADPFTVELPNTAVVWEGLTTQTVTWNKGTTDTAPINCSFVTIKLSTDGGLTFPITILSNTPNDGSQDIVVPDNPTTEARIMIEAVDNLFYNVNAIDFTINGATASIDDTILQDFKLFPNPAKDVLNLHFKMNDSNDVEILLYDLQGRTVRRVLYNNQSQKFEQSISTKDVASGIYLIKVNSGNKSVTKKLIIE
tara:strand:+ start:12339 stop:14558 length:2220 start_codon:yes stop_codon:yes gene_type:complete